MSQFLLLEQIDNPSDLKKLTQSQLHQLSKELREFILYKVSKTGGHLASNLGSVELTVALHYIYNTPEDLLVWDVGHQSYAHKILTKRRKLMDTLRQFDGIAGFPKRDESPYDTFGVGHSSTSISAGLGMSVANQCQNKTNKTVAIIGDGSMTAGLAFEGLNNAGWLDSDILVILNDNEMSISENVGAISRYLSHVLASRFYNSVKSMANQALGLIPPIQQIAHKVEEHVKGMLMPSTMFEELGFNYIGPIDGHDIDQLVNTLRQIRELSGPQFLHVVTTKGQGYKLAEYSPIEYHAVPKFNLDDGMASLVDAPKMTYTQVFGRWLLDLAKLESNFVAITPAMREGSGMVDFARLYPKQFFDVGIAEQHAITFAAGVATQGVKAIVAIYSTFLQRGYDQLIHDVALQNLPVMFAIDRAGIVGADGPTHIGAFDLSYLNCIPNMVIMAPSDENECYHMLWTAYKLDKPTAVRYPRGSGIGVTINNEEVINYEIGRGNCLRNGEKVAILAFGSMVHIAVDVGNTLNATVCNMRFIKPLDVDLIQQICLTHDYIVTIEENVIIGGAGSRCMQVLQELGVLKPVLNLGLPDEFIPHGDVKILLKLCGLDKEGIIRKIQAFVDKS